jgi:hypothetical protein
VRERRPLEPHDEPVLVGVPAERLLPIADRLGVDVGGELHHAPCRFQNV